MGRARLQLTRFRFGDVVRQVKDKVSPTESGLSRYVAGEHMYTDDLRIRRWGEINADYLGPAFHMRFRPGQVLYGSRRTYLRKVAVADFEGICANTTFVLEAKDRAVLLPELLPFIMTTEAFHEHSIKQSKGSVNPYVNFSDLAWYEFALPGMAEQRRVCDLLERSWAVIETTRRATELARVAELAAVDRWVVSWFNSYGQIKLQKVFQRPPESGCSAPPTNDATGHWVLSLSALQQWGYSPGELKPVEPSDKLTAARLDVGDLLISRSNTRERVGFVGVFDELLDEPVSFPDTMMRLRLNAEAFDKRVLELILQSSPLRRRIMAIAAGTSASMKKINRKTLGGIDIPQPPKEVQRRVLTTRDELRAVSAQCASRTKQHARLHRQLLQLLNWGS